MSDVLVPQGLFERVLKRLGIEKQIRSIQRHLGVFASLEALFIILSGIAFFGLWEVLFESSFGPYFALLFTDPGIVVTHWHSYGYSLIESVPSIAVMIVLFSLGFLLLFFKLVMNAFQSWKQIKKSV